MDRDAGGRRQAIFEMETGARLDWLREEHGDVEIGAPSGVTPNSRTR
jgi:hypothetical protein